MKKKEILGSIAVLTFITTFSGYLLAQVYKTTKPKIDKQKMLQEEKLNKDIFPDGVRFEAKSQDPSCVTVFNENGDNIGRIFKIRSLGYGGFITIKVGVDNNHEVKKIKILDNRETPGLGSKITGESFLKQFAHQTVNEMYLKKDNKNGKIDAITAATISSRAVTDEIRKLLENLGGTKE